MTIPQARAEWADLSGIATPLVVVGQSCLLGFDPEEFETKRSLEEQANG